MTEVGVVDHQWRLDADHVSGLTADADKNAGLAANTANLSGFLGSGLLRGAVADQFDADHETEPSYVADQGVPRFHLVQPFERKLALAGGCFQQLLVAHDIYIRNGRCTRDR